MQLATAALALLVLVIILSLLRNRLVSELCALSLLIFGSTKPGLVLYSILVLPGTIIHELSHWLLAEILRVRTGRIMIFPELAELGATQQLGSVETEKTDPFRGFLIGIAPFLSGIAILLALGSVLSAGWGSFPLWALALVIYGIMVIGNSMMISRQDRATWPFILIMLALIVVVLVKYYPHFLSDNTGFLLPLIQPVNQVLGVTAALNLAMILAAYLLRATIEKLTNRRIVHNRSKS